MLSMLFSMRCFTNRQWYEVQDKEYPTNLRLIHNKLGTILNGPSSFPSEEF